MYLNRDKPTKTKPRLEGSLKTDLLDMCYSSTIYVSLDRTLCTEK